jgi:DNA-binding MarR family transcriptional regulator
MATIADCYTPVVVDTNPPELRLLDALFRLNKSVLADVRIHVAAAGDLDLVDFLALRTIELGIDTPGDLARDLGLNPAVISRTLTKLTHARMIQRHIDVADSRRSRITLTSKGAQTIAAIAARVRPGLAARLNGLAAKEVSQLLDTLERL